jgi:hypothetical protein
MRGGAKETQQTFCILVARPSWVLLGVSCQEIKFMTMHTIIEPGEGSQFWWKSAQSCLIEGVERVSSVRQAIEDVSYI